MRRLHSSSAFRFIAIFLVMSGLLALSNRCVLGMGLMVTQGGVAQECCENARTAAHPEHPATGGSTTCCQAVNAVAQDAAKTVSLKPELTEFLFAVAWLVEAEARDDGPDLALRRGVELPLAGSFRELVLQRSLLAHAPPVLI